MPKSQPSGFLHLHWIMALPSSPRRHVYHFSRMCMASSSQSFRLPASDSGKSIKFVVMLDTSRNSESDGPLLKNPVASHATHSMAESLSMLPSDRSRDKTRNWRNSPNFLTSRQCDAKTLIRAANSHMFLQDCLKMFPLHVQFSRHICQSRAICVFRKRLTAHTVTTKKQSV